MTRSESGEPPEPRRIRTDPAGSAALPAPSSTPGDLAMAALSTAYADALEEVAQLKRAMVSRAGIEQAKGIFMGQRRCDPDEAFKILVTLSNQTNRKLHDVAVAVIEHATGHALTEDSPDQPRLRRSGPQGGG